MSSYDQTIALHEAAKQGKYEIVKQLLANKADPNMVDKWRITPLHYASGRRQKEVVELLLAHHADPNLANIHGNTPLHRASRNGDVEVVALLLAHHADSNLADGDGSTPLHWASGRGHVKVVEMLLAHHADPNLADKHGTTPLQLTSWRRHAQVVELLLANGADPKNTTLSFPDPQFAAELLVHGASSLLMLNYIKKTKGLRIPRDFTQLLQRWPVVQPLQILCQRVIRVHRVDTSNTPPLLMAPLDPRDVLEVETKRRRKERKRHPLDSSSTSNKRQR